ncbi:MAG: dockerin type I repeat-containing protein [Muribaculaceae bacterium]|nr:dockerin type I repeat-containing protein [Muribaculaceae bacterium]
MKKLYLSLILALMAMGATAQVDNISTSWAHLFEACPPTMGSDMALTGDAIYYVMLSGTTQGAGDSGFPKEYSDPTLSVYYGGEKICTGAPYEGASYNNNINVVKTDRNGNFQWVVYSTSGEFSDGHVATAADGSIYVATKVRHTDNMRTSNILITDATGITTTFAWQLESEEDSRYNRGLLIKIGANGALQWLRPIDVSTAAQPSATGNYAKGTFDAISIDDILSDASGNCYVAGRYANPMSLYRADGSALELTPHNTTGWNGDTQETRGDLFVAKFDGNGYIIDAFTTQGHSGAEAMTRLAWNGDDIVLSSFVKGIAASDYITVGSDTYNTPDGNQSILLACLNKQLQPKWSRFYKGSRTNKNKTSTMQWNDLQVAGNSIILNGMGNFTLDNGMGGTLATQNASREGFVIKFDAATGVWQAGTTSMAAFPTINPRGTEVPNSAINGWVGCFEAQNDSLYVFGYNQGQQTVYLASLSSDDLQPGAIYHLIKGGSQPTAITSCASGSRLYTMSRGKVLEDYDDDGNVCGYYQDFEYINSEIHTSPIPKNEQGYFSSFAMPLAAFDLPFEVKEFTSSVIGDVNGDGTVTSVDVTVLYNYILNGDSSALVNGDQDGDGSINSGDVTIIYNILLGNN